MNIQKVQLPPAKPDCCAECPLLGIVPKTVERPKYSKETHLCIGTAPPEALSERATRKRASECDAKHPLRRPCDLYWDMWMGLPRRILNVNRALYRDSRLPYMATQYPEIKFHNT